MSLGVRSALFYPLNYKGIDIGGQVFTKPKCYNIIYKKFFIYTAITHTDTTFFDKNIQYSIQTLKKML